MSNIKLKRHWHTLESSRGRKHFRETAWKRNDTHKSRTLLKTFRGKKIISTKRRKGTEILDWKQTSICRNTDYYYLNRKYITTREREKQWQQTPSFLGSCIQRGSEAYIAFQARAYNKPPGNLGLFSCIANSFNRAKQRIHVSKGFTMGKPAGRTLDRIRSRQGDLLLSIPCRNEGPSQQRQHARKARSISWWTFSIQKQGQCQLSACPAHTGTSSHGNRGAHPQLGCPTAPPFQ